MSRSPIPKPIPLQRLMSERMKVQLSRGGAYLLPPVTKTNMVLWLGSPSHGAGAMTAKDV